MEVRGTNVHYSVFFLLFLIILLRCGVKVAKLLFDATFASQKDYELVQRAKVEVYSPVNGNTPSDEPTDRG